MSDYLFHLTGCQERMLVKVDAQSLSDLAQDLSGQRFLLGRIVAVNGEWTSRDALIPVSRIGMIVEPE
jgi:hypothetical protein